MSRVRMGLMLLALALAGCSGAGGAATYGEPTRFAVGREIVFPDFRLRYQGERRVEHPVFKPGFVFYDFEVTGRQGAQTVSWSSGTGVIDATEFTVDGRPFVLELRASVARKGWLRQDELVVWPEAEFRAAARRR